MMGFSVPAERQASVYGVSDFLLETDVVIGKLAHFGIIDTENFRLFGGAHTEARDVMHNPEDDGCYNERPGETGGRVCELDTKLSVIVVQPTSRYKRRTIEISNARLSEEAGQHVPDDTANGMAGKNIESIVLAKYEFELRSKVAQSPGHKTEKDGSGSSNET